MTVAKVWIFAAMFLANATLAKEAVDRDPAALPPVSDPKGFGVQKLRDAGASDDFVRLVLSLYDESERARIVELNVLGFLGHGDYSGHYSKRALQKCRQFMERNGASLRRAHSQYNVSKEVLAALLWVETKHGKTLGNINVPQVYFSLLQADHPDVLKATLAALEVRQPSPSEEYREKTRKRSEEKAAWALVQLRALEEIYKRSAKKVSALNGSYAGAFGIPQFIPTSYLKWARTRKKPPSSPNIFRMEDAIDSAAFYLHSNGWNDADPATQREALYHYNRSREYVDVILRIAAALRATQKGPRSLAGEHRKK